MRYYGQMFQRWAITLAFFAVVAVVGWSVLGDGVLRVAHDGPGVAGHVIVSGLLLLLAVVVLGAICGVLLGLARAVKWFADEGLLDWPSDRAHAAKKRKLKRQGQDAEIRALRREVEQLQARAKVPAGIPLVSPDAPRDPALNGNGPKHD